MPTLRNTTRKNGAYIAAFITLFDGGTNKQALRAELKEEAYKKGIVVFVASMLQNFSTLSNW